MKKEQLVNKQTQLPFYVLEETDSVEDVLRFIMKYFKNHFLECIHNYTQEIPLPIITDLANTYLIYEENQKLMGCSIIVICKHMDKILKYMDQRNMNQVDLNHEDHDEQLLSCKGKAEYDANDKKMATQLEVMNKNIEIQKEILREIRYQENMQSEFILKILKTVTMLPAIMTSINDKIDNVATNAIKTEYADIELWEEIYATSQKLNALILKATQSRSEEQ